MELVIDIPEKLYDKMKTYQGLDNTYMAVKHGIPLPKGHGDLKDADKLKHAFIKWSMAVQGSFTDSDIASIVYNSPTIIEADNESEGINGRTDRICNSKNSQ